MSLLLPSLLLQRSIRSLTPPSPCCSVAFSKKVDPDNAAIQKLEKFCQENAVSTGKSTIGDEKEWNVFMRTSSKAVQDATGTKDPIEAMGKLREMKVSSRVCCLRYTVLTFTCAEQGLNSYSLSHITSYPRGAVAPCIYKLKPSIQTSF